MNNSNFDQIQEEQHHHSFDQTSSHEDFLEQMLNSLPSWPQSSELSPAQNNPNNHKSSFPWENSSQGNGMMSSFDDQSVMLASKLRQNQISSGGGGGGGSSASAALSMLQQQLFMARGLATALQGNDSGVGDSGLLPLPVSLSGDDDGDGSSFKSMNPGGGDGSVQALFNGFTGSLHASSQTSNQAQQFHQSQNQNYGGAVGGMSQTQANGSGSGSGGGGGGVVKQNVQEENDVVSFSKVLTPSDANNGGGFSVPRFCADLIFPPLDFEADPPVQNLGVRDVHCVVWEFRHIYRGTPRRHLLTTGWSKFVNSKKLVAGDSVVFMRNRHSGEMSVGIRRAVKANADCNSRWNYYEDRREMEGFSRNVKGRVAAEAVEEAAELAAKGLGFEIVYYPRSGSADFVVRAEKVEGSFSVFWTMGMRVKMAVETEDSSRMTWFQGTVTSAGLPDNGPWRGSPWRMLQVTWDEPEARQNVKRVSPWQVESVVATPSLHSEFNPTKKCRISQDLGLLPDGDGELLFPMTGLSHSLMEHLNPSWMNYNSFPASIQGARQDQICVSGVSSVIRENSHQIWSNYLIGNISPMTETVSTELNIGSSQLENLSTDDSQSSVHFFGNEQVRKPRVCNLPPKVGFSSIQLFGKIINTTNPVEGCFDDIRCTEDDGSNVYKETGIDHPLGHSLTYPFTESVDS